MTILKSVATIITVQSLALVKILSDRILVSVNMDGFLTKLHLNVMILMNANRKESCYL